MAFNPIVDEEKCAGCEECVEACPAEAISMANGIAVISADECTECGTCSKKCKMGAIAADGKTTRQRECILCQTCKAVCPVDAVRYLPGQPSSPDTTTSFSTKTSILCPLMRCPLY